MYGTDLCSIVHLHHDHDFFPQYKRDFDISVIFLTEISQFDILPKQWTTSFQQLMFFQNNTLVR